MKSERDSSLGSSLESESEENTQKVDSVGSAAYIKQLNALTQGKMSIAEKKLKGKISPLARKMSVCFGEDQFKTSTLL